MLINAVGQVATLTFDDRTGEVLARHDANGVGITHTYDAFGRETLVAAADGGSTRTSYDNLGMPGVQSISVVVDDGGAGIYTRRTLDGLGRTVTVQRSGGAAGVVQHIAYADASAHPSFQSHWADVGGPVVSEAFTYDFRGRLAGVTHPDGSGTSMIYTARGRTAVDEVGSQRTTEIDAWGLTRRVVEPHNGGVVTTTYEYDALDRVVRSTDPAGNVIQSTYDKLGRLVGATDPDLGQLTYTYDDAGNILTAVDGRGVVTTFTYDASNRITGKTNSLNGRSIALHYDEPSSAHGIGRLTSVEDDESGPGCARGSVLSYDELGRVVSQTECLDGVTQTLTRSYDIAGHPRRITFPDGDVMDYLYDSMGHVVSVPGYVTEIRYDAEDRPTRLALANGVVRNRTYDPARSWLAAETLTGPSGVLRTASYTRRADALVLAEATTTNVKTPVVENVSYAYDEQGRLVATSGSLVEHFAYDLIGNMISKSGVAYTYPAYGPGQPRVHAALSAGTTTFDYDGGGNLVAERDSKGKAVRTFTWDESGALAAVHAPGSTGKGAFTAYGYNAFGLRTREVVIDGKITSTTLTFFPEVETNGGPHLVKHCFVAGQRLASKDWKGAVTYYHTNPLGSVVLLTDASGAIAKGNAFFRYDSFGARLSGNAAQANGFTFTGQRQTDLTSPDAANPGLGLVHMGARTYDPSTARFLSPDTVMPGRGVLGRNRYAYANQNPRAYVDPSGHEGEPTEEEPPPAGWTTDGHGNAVSLADYTKDDGTLVIHEVAPVPEPAPAPLFSGSSGLAVPSTTPAPSLDTVYANGARTDVFLVTTSDRQLYADTLSQINFSNRRQIVVDARGLSPQQVYDSLRAIGDTQNKRLIVEDHGTWASRGGNVMFWGDGQITAEWLKSNPALAELLGKTLGLFGEVELTHCNIACGDGRLLTTLSSLAPATVIYGNSGPGNVERVSGEALECFVGACQSVIREPEGP